MQTILTLGRQIAHAALREPVRFVALIVAVANVAGVAFDADAADSLRVLLETLAALGAGEALRQFTSPAHAPNTAGGQ